MNVRSIRLGALLILAIGGALAGRAAIYATFPEEEIDALGMGASGPAEPENPEWLEGLREDRRRIASLHRPKTPPLPGEWLDRHKEPGQTFEQYRVGGPNRPSRRLTTLYIQPWGEFEAGRRRLLERSAEMLGRFYGVPVVTLDPVGLARVPAEARRRRPDWDAERIDTSYVLEALIQRRPKDAVGLLALTTADLSPGGGRWVFGQASLFDRVGVWSLFRQGDPEADFTACLRRTLKTALHESGHVFGIAHCAAFECGMNGAGGRVEADSRPLWFCAECETKVWWAGKLDTRRRYARLAEFAQAEGLEPEARFWRASLDALGGGGRPGGVAVPR